MADALQSPATGLADRAYGLAALLGCIAERIEGVRDRVETCDPDACDKLQQALRAIQHCEGLADKIAEEVEGVHHG